MMEGSGRSLAVQLTGFEAMTEDDMPIRIKHRDKTLNARQVAEDSRISTPL